MGSFPVEQARSGWAVIDGLARQYVQDGRSTGVDQARADALMDLIHSRATGTFVVQLAVPAVGAAREADRGVGTGPVRGADPQADPGAGTDGPAGLHAGWDDTDGAGDAGQVVTVAGLGMPGFTQVRRDWIRGLVSRATDEPSHVKAPDPTHQSGATQAPDAIAAPGPSTTTRSEVVTCHADTGALMSVQPSAGVRGNRARATKAHRPPLGLVELVKARDGRCRFPGCTVSAVFCDLDHVRPWPSGPTRATNLMCLCRRHHRIKQTARWRVRIEPDASVRWTDPTGRVRTTLPLDFLQGVREDPVTRSDRASGEPRLYPAPGQRPPRSPRDDTGDHWSAWEDELTHWVATAERDRARRRAERRPPARSLHPPYRPALTWHAVAVGAGARPLDLPPPGHGSRASPRRRASSAGAEEPPPF